MSNLWKRIFRSHSITMSLGKYPSCDHLNVALRELLGNPSKNERAISEILYAIDKADGYLLDDVRERLEAMGFYRRRVNMYKLSKDE